LGFEVAIGGSDLEMEAVRGRLRDLSSERRRLIEEFRRLRLEGQQQRDLGIDSVREPYPARPDEKVQLFLKRFGARRDLYPHRWENAGRSGYSPVVESIWEEGRRLKPSEIYARFGPGRFSRLDEAAVEAHLRGRQTIGTYAIRTDDSCIFLAADYDGEGWPVDVFGFRDVAAELGIDSLVEISRSGKGAHVWIFFAEAVPAYLARALGALILQRTAGLNPSLHLDSYDRFFPNQDSLPKGGFGNLIALPLQKERRGLGFTEFIDDSLAPFPDQWVVLAEVQLLRRGDLQLILEDALLTEVGEEAEPLELAERIDDSMSLDPLDLPVVGDWKVVHAERLTIPTIGLPAQLIGRLKQLATFANPVFFEKQRLRFPTYNIPRYIFCGELHADRLILPRGVLEEVVELFAGCGSRLEVEDRRLSERHRRWRFTGTLNAEQNSAVSELVRHEHGVLVAPPGSGKSVMACAWIGSLKLATLVLVNRQVLLDQWRTRLTEFLSVGPEQVGMWRGSRRKLTGKIDVVMMQSLAKEPDVRRFFRDYDAVVIDECHHVPAVSFEALMRECGCRQVLGLTATPKRKDRLERLLFFECGPIRYRFGSESMGGLERTVFVRSTSFDLTDADGRSVPLHQVWQALVSDENRNCLIADGICEALRRKRVPLVVSDRKEHLRLLYELVRLRVDSRDTVLEMVQGGQTAKVRQDSLARFFEAVAAGRPAVLFATASLLGEGFDLPVLDTLFLAMPISFSGRLVQYAGRLHRRYPGKGSVEVHDYLDERLPLACSMYRKRLPGYREMGYRVVRE
jgi:superfamily II DNA or RNA helicase